MIAFIEGHRVVFGAGPICRVLGIAPSTYYAFKAVERDPELASDRARRDLRDMAAVRQDFEDSRGRYGARKVWHQLRRNGHDIARCTVERLTTSASSSRGKSFFLLVLPRFSTSTGSKPKGATPPLKNPCREFSAMVRETCLAVSPE